MATMNKTFSVKTGLDLANTIILDSNRNLSNINIANLHTINANSIVTVDGLNVIDQANVARTTANDAYAQANTGRDQANTARGTANDAYAQANTARDTANDAYGQANTARTTANNAYGQANLAYAQANAAYGQANLAYAEANISANTVSVTVGGLTLNNKKLFLQNTNSMTIELLDDGTNANLVLRSSGGVAYDTANAAYGQANAARDQANTARGTANDAYAQANTARDTANDAYGQANTARDTANNAYARANGAYNTANLKVASIAVSGNGLAVSNVTSANVNDYTVSVNVATTTDRGTTLLIDSTSSTDTGNAATANAVNATFNYAATKLPLTGGTISGDLTIDGNLYLSQNTTLINVSTYQVEDPLIYLASNNDISDTVDIGFMGGKNNSGTYSHTGLIRHAADQKYYLFDGLADEAHSNNVVNVAATYLATLRANLEANSITLVGNTVATAANTEAAYNQANAAYGQANAAYSQANAAYADSNTRVLRSGDTMTGNLTVNAFINTNTVFVNKKTALAAPNTAHQDGERLRLFDFANPGQPNYAIGVEPNHIWTATDDNSGATGFKWYGNTTQAMYLKSNGDLFLSNTINAKAFVTSAGLNVTDQANNAYAEANAAANTVMVSANSGSSLTKKKLNFVNSASIQVSVADAGDGNANITFVTTGAAVADAYAQANAAYGQANAARDQANTGYAQANAAYGQANLAYAQANAAYSTANVKIETITGLGAIQIGSGSTNNVVSYSVNVNTASISVVGVTKLVDSITSNDTGNAATANAVSWLNDKKVDRAGDTMTGKLTINVASEGLEVGNANVTNTLTVEALKVTTNTVTTAASGQVVLDVFPTTELASAKYFVQANSGSTYHTTEIVLVQEGTNIWMTEYGSIQLVLHWVRSVLTLIVEM